MKKNILNLFICEFLLCSAICASSCKLPEKKLTIIKSNGTEISVKAEIADTEETREKGYMFRKNIPDGSGMLFVFERDEIQSFWMKNTPHPLSIAYINSDGKIRDIFDMTPYSLASIVSTGYIRYALEVPQGWFKKNGINEGDYLKIDFIR